MPAPRPEYGTKGTHLIKATEWVDSKLGSGAFAKLAREYGGGTEWEAPVASGWYSVPVLSEVLSAAGAKLGLSLEQVSHQIATLNAADDLRTIYRFFMSVFGPVNVLKGSELMFKTYINFGKVTVLRNESKVFEDRIDGIPHALIPWVSGVTLGFLNATISAAGGQTPSGKVTGTGKMNTGNLHWVQFTFSYQ